MSYTVKKSPFIKRNLTINQIMGRLSLALIVVYLFGLYNASRYGQGFIIRGIINLLISLGVSIGSEFIFALIKKEKPLNYIRKSFVWISALIYTLIMPVNTKYHVLAISMLVGVVLGKLIFGGFGKNFLNPAGLAKLVSIYFFPNVISVDAISAPTITTRLSLLNWITDAWSLDKVINAYGGLDSVLVGTYFGALGETCTILILLLGIYLALREVIDYRIPITYLGTLFIGYLIIGMIKNIGILYPLVAISTGGVAFGAIFMLTDPVTSPDSRSGKIIYAAIAALLTVIIRHFTSYPEGVIIAILITNCLNLLINQLFIGKQFDLNKRNIILVLCSIVIAISTIPLLSNSINPGTLVPQEKEDKNTKVMYSFTGEYPDYKAEIISKDGNIYRVSVYGYGMLPKSMGGQGGAGEYSPNEFDIEIVDGKIKSITCIKFGDTLGVGDAALNQEYLDEFIGLDINSEMDAYTGATFTSTSMIAAIAKALAE